MQMSNMQITATEALLHILVPPSTVYASIYKVKEVHDPDYVNDTGFEIKFFEFLDSPSRALDKHHPLYINSMAQGYKVLPLESISKLKVKPIQAAMAYAIDYNVGALTINCSSVEMQSGEGFATPQVTCNILAEISASVNTSSLRGYELGDVKCSPRKEGAIKMGEVAPKEPPSMKLNSLSLALMFAGL